MSLFTTLKNWFEGEGKKLEDVLSPFEHALLQKFHPLFHQIETTLGQQGVKIAEDALTGVITTVETGGNIGAGVAAAATQALGQIEADAKADARNAVYGVLAATVASLPVPAAAPATPAA